MNITLFQEEPGIISENACYVIFADGYMYSGDTVEECIWEMLLEWKNDKHIVG
jgi:hypothetical protein